MLVFEERGKAKTQRETYKKKKPTTNIVLSASTPGYEQRPLGLEASVLTTLPPRLALISFRTTGPWMIR